MIKTDSAVYGEIKSFFKKSKSLIGFLILLCSISGIVYFCFWVLTVAAGDGILKYTEHIFLPLASFLNPSAAPQDYGIYFRTSLKLFGFIIPFWLISIILEKIEEALISFCHKLDKIKEEKLIIENKQKTIKKFNEIKSFTICLSIDCKLKNGKEVPSKTLYEKIRNSFSDCNTNINKTFIILSNDFKNYDEIYERLLQILAKIKKQLENKYNAQIIFSITTDAYKTARVDFDNIEKEHFEILSFKFKGKSSTSALFLKKYKFLNQNKYGGIPIGQFNSFNSQDDKNYELNIVDKNLSKTLTNLI